MIFRLILLGLVIWAGYQFIQYFGKSANSKSGSAGKPEAMAKCDYCGTHFPEQEAIVSGDKTYCSPKHRDLGEST